MNSPGFRVVFELIAFTEEQAQRFAAQVREMFADAQTDIKPMTISGVAVTSPASADDSGSQPETVYRRPAQALAKPMARIRPECPVKHGEILREKSFGWKMRVTEIKGEVFEVVNLDPNAPKNAQRRDVPYSMGARLFEPWDDKIHAQPDPKSIQPSRCPFAKGQVLRDKAAGWIVSVIAIREDAEIFEVANLEGNAPKNAQRWDVPFSSAECFEATE